MSKKKISRIIVKKSRQLGLSSITNTENQFKKASELKGKRVCVLDYEWLLEHELITLEEYKNGIR